jgi:hypothetical protein
MDVCLPFWACVARSVPSRSPLALPHHHIHMPPMSSPCHDRRRPSDTADTHRHSRLVWPCVTLILPAICHSHASRHRDMASSASTLWPPLRPLLDTCSSVAFNITLKSRTRESAIVSRFNGTSGTSLRPTSPAARHSIKSNAHSTF